MSSNDLLQPVPAIERHVRFAVELVDPVTLELVHAGITVRAKGIDAQPIMSLSGRFVWLGQEATLPDEIRVDPGSLPYEPEAILNPKPVDAGANARAQDKKLIRLTLRPTTNYPFEDGITSVRARLLEGGPPKPVSNAEVWLQWLDAEPRDHVWTDSLCKSRTQKSGDFVAVLRLPREAKPYKPEETPSMLHLHLVAKRGLEVRRTKAVMTNVRDGQAAQIPDPFIWSALQRL
jgi:hypothetical protein